MGSIKLDEAIEIKPPISTNEVRDFEVVLSPDKITVRLDWMYQEYDSSVPPLPVGDPVLRHQEHFVISGTPLDELMSATVSPAHVGKNFWVIMRKGIRNKIKELKSLQGTDE